VGITEWLVMLWGYEKTRNITEAAPELRVKTHTMGISSVRRISGSIVFSLCSMYMPKPMFHRGTGCVTRRFYASAYFDAFNDVFGGGVSGRARYEPAAVSKWQARADARAQWMYATIGIRQARADARAQWRCATIGIRQARADARAQWRCATIGL
jgi:hypothetical protein